MIQRGDVVGLTCGGPKMTVYEVTPGEERDDDLEWGDDAGDVVLCNWFNADDELEKR